MNEEEVAKRMLVFVGIAMTCAEKLMESEDVNVRVFALDTFTKLAEMEMTFMNALGVKGQSGDSNPLGGGRGLAGENRNYKLPVIPIFQRCSGCGPSSSPTGSGGC